MNKQLTPAKVKRMQNEQQKANELTQAVNTELQRWMEETVYEIHPDEKDLIDTALGLSLQRLTPETLKCDYGLFVHLLNGCEVYSYFELSKALSAITGAQPHVLGEIYIQANNLCREMAVTFREKVQDKANQIETALTPTKQPKRTGAVKDAQTIADGKS